MEFRRARIDVKRGSGAVALERAGRKAVLGSWERYQKVAETIRQAWPEDMDSQDLLDEVRR